ncbi:MAG: DUF3048 domain-containing protein [Actinobacteria bacterium]|nr:DUF3048 domain-containing protein [Actinomycetota bacterium]
MKGRRPMSRRTLILASSLLVVVSILVAACGGGKKQSTAETTTSTTVVLPTWPLTGSPSADAPTSGAHPAIVVKMDNSPDARPQTGIERADVVYELLVEGITRFALVFHSQLPEPVWSVTSPRRCSRGRVATPASPLRSRPPRPRVF